MFALDKQRRRVQARYKLAYGRDGKAVPPSPTLLWEAELFEVALHEELCGLAGRLWESGQWELGLEDALLRRVLPNARLHLGLAASRTARPAWPSAETVIEGISALPALGDDDPMYAGWTRLALVERTYRPDPKRPYRAPVEAITVLSGAVALPLGAKTSPNLFPFKDGDVDDWWWPEPPPALFLSRLSMGQVVHLARASDWLGDAFVLIPPAALFSYLCLEPALYGGPLVWRDARGDPGIVLRTWWVRNPETFSAESAASEGADLLLRPDLLKRVNQGYGVPLREASVVWRRPIGNASEQD